MSRFDTSALCFDCLEAERQHPDYQKAVDAELAKERRLQDALLSIKKQFGKNAVLKAMSLQEGATAKDIYYG